MTPATTNHGGDTQQPMTPSPHQPATPRTPSASHDDHEGDSAEARGSTRRRRGRLPLVTGGLAAVAASSCCLGPLLLLTLGFSGSWIGNLAALEPYRPVFLAVAVAALLAAGWRIFRPVRSCTPDEICATPRTRTIYKVSFAIVSALVVIALGFPYVMPLFY